MNFKTFYNAFVFPVLMLFVATAQTASGQDSIPVEAANQINLANELVRDGKFDEAIQEYAQVQPNATDRDELDYNLAVAKFRKGELGAAKDLFTTAASSSDTKIAANSRYNLGNCLYSKALKTAEQDKPAAIEQLRKAISHYRSSLQINSENANARANIELAGELIRKLHEKQKQEQQQQQDQQQDQNQDQQNQSGESKEDQQQQDQGDQQQPNQNDPQQKSQGSESEKQDSNENGSENKQKQDQSDKSDSGESKPDEQKSGDEQSDSEKGQSESKQQQDSKESDSQNEEPVDQQKAQSDSQDDQSKGQQSQDPEQQSRDSNGHQDQKESDQQSQDQAQNSQTGQTQRNRPQANRPTDDQQQPDANVGEEETDKEDQAVPTGELTAAGEQDGNGKSAGSVAMADPNTKDGLMTKEEALKMLQAVRDRDMLRRLRQEQLERSRHVPVDRDW